MLTCLPKSLCNWNFEVTGSPAGRASVNFDFFTEQGDISLGGSSFAVRKHGPFSGHWTLENGGQIIVEANKPNALFRSFELQVGNVQFTVKARSAFTRSFDFSIGGQNVGVIRPAHPLTRRAFIECAAEIPDLAQLFAFWLVVLTWKRAANNAAASK